MAGEVKSESSVRQLAQSTAQVFCWYLLPTSQTDKMGSSLGALLLPLVRKLQHYKILTFPLEYCLFTISGSTIM